MPIGVYTWVCCNEHYQVKTMQDYETSQDGSTSLEEENSRDQFGGLVKALLKRLVVFVCFGPGVLGVLWIIGRLFKR
jgi:hypothetical protein